MKNRAPIVIAIIILHLFFLSCANETNQTKTSTTNSKVSNNLHTESDEKMGHLVGVWLDAHNSKAYNQRIGQKIVLKDNKFYYGPCDIDKESLEINTLSSVPYSEIVYNGKEYVDMNISDQKLIITKSGDLKIYDQLGLVDTYAKIFIDPTILKF
ncbi:hypothetical protein [Sphingobacterium sp. UBA6320]|uniref:hypothetical protein n=1 Tax=Sphingobacterium sp. UBA6320 TaxID=1947510 RepID=UPI0025E986E2|nr:hypothetical protein [Sphingobacterium sp. UBA6320]